VRQETHLPTLDRCCLDRSDKSIRAQCSSATYGTHIPRGLNSYYLDGMIRRSETRCCLHTKRSARNVPRKYKNSAVPDLFPFNFVAPVNFVLWSRRPSRKKFANSWRTFVESVIGQGVGLFRRISFLQKRAILDFRDDELPWEAIGMMLQRCRTPDLITHAWKLWRTVSNVVLKLPNLAKCILDSPAANLWWHQGERKHDHRMATLYSLLHKFGA
jgi:hypothetical protein